LSSSFFTAFSCLLACSCSSRDVTSPFTTNLVCVFLQCYFTLFVYSFFPGSTAHRAFNFLTHGYNIDFYFWEVVVTLRKIVISAIIVFLNTINLRFQIYCIMLVSRLLRRGLTLRSDRCSGPGHLLLCHSFLPAICHSQSPLDGVIVRFAQVLPLIALCSPAAGHSPCSSSPAFAV
jgi:hypothetical protein